MSGAFITGRAIREKAKQQKGDSTRKGPCGDRRYGASKTPTGNTGSEKQLVTSACAQGTPC